MKKLVVAAVAAVMSVALFGATLNVPGDYATIELALDAANDGDVIALAAGTYSRAENAALVAISGEVEIASASGDAADVVIDLGGTGCGFALNNAKAKISKITFTSSAEMGDSADLTLPRFVDVVAGTVEGCVFRDITIGGAANKASYPVRLSADGVITGCRFLDVAGSVSPKQGGVILAEGGVISNTHFVACNVYQAPIMTTSTVSLFVEDCSFTGITSKASYGAIHVNKKNVAGKYDQVPVFRRTVVANNTVANSGAAYYYSASMSNKAMRFEDCIFTNNVGTAKNGVLEGDFRGCITCDRCLFADNVGEKQGVANGVNCVSQIFRNCLFLRNTGKTGGGVVIDTVGGDYLAFENCTVTGNKTETGAVAGISIADTSASSTWVKNCIVWGNLKTGEASPTQLSVDAARVFNTCYPEAAPGNANGNVSVNPLFGDDGKLLYASPCLDVAPSLASTAGTLDLVGTERPQAATERGAVWDMGCYEMPPNTAALEVTVTLDAKVGAVPATVTATANVLGTKLDGLTFDWSVTRTSPAGSTVEEHKGLSEPALTLTGLEVGTYTFFVKVTNSSLDEASATCPDVFSASVRDCYVSKTGSATWPYDTEAKATPSFADAIANAAVSVKVVPGTYDLSAAGTLLEVSKAVEITSASGNAADVIIDLGGTGYGFALNNAGAKISKMTFTSSAPLGDSAALAFPRFVNVIEGTLEGCVFRDITIGGTSGKGSYPVKLSAVGVITGCQFANLTGDVSTPAQGGAVYAEGGVISNTQFIACNTYLAPVVTPGSTTLSVEDCLFTGIESTSTSKTASYGAIFASSGNTAGPNVVVRRTKVANNKVPSSGAVYYYSATMNNKPMKFEDCVFAKNVGAGLSGVLEGNSRGCFTCVRCRFTDNVGNSYGVINPVSSVIQTFRNCLMCGNTGKTVAGVANENQGSFVLESCTVTGNRTETGSIAGIRITDTSWQTWVKNSIVWGNTGAETQLSVDVNKVSYSCYPEAVEGNTKGNISEDPRLVTTRQHRGYPAPGSPCADAGTASGWTAADVDLAGRPRLRDGKIDMGCYQIVPLPGLMLMLK